MSYYGGPLNPRSILILLTPSIVFGIFWSSRSTALTQFIGLESFKISPISPISSPLFVSIIKSTFALNLLHHIINFLCVTLNPFEISCFIWYCGSFLSFNKYVSINQQSQCTLLPFAYTLLLQNVLFSLAIFHPFLYVILLLNSFFKLPLYTQFLSLRYQSLDILKSFQVDSTFSLMSTRFSLYNSGQLSQFVLSFHLVTVLTALLIPLPGKTLQYILPSILILEHCLSISSPPNLQPRQSIHHFHAIRETEPVISEQRITATLFAEKPVLPLPRVLDEMIVTKEIPAVYDKLIFLNRFLGTWKLIRSRSDPMEEVSKAMNVSWAIRKVFEKFTPSCRYKRDGAILTIEQLLPMNITKNIVLHIDGNEHYENDSNIGAWSTITNSIIHEQTVVSQRRRKNDGLIAIETRKILTEGEIEKGIPDLLKDVLWYKVEVKRCLDGPIIASANRFLSREEAPPIGIPMPWDASMKTQGTVERLIEEEETAETPIPLLASLDELPLALPSLMIVENDSRRAIRKKRISNISDKHQDDKQQSDKHQRSKRLMYSKLSFRNKEFRSVHWNEQQCLHKCIRDLVRLKELNVHINQIQYVVDLSQTVAEQIHYLCSMDDPTQIELKLRKTDSSTKGKFWTMIRSEHNLIIDKMMLEIGRPTIGRSSTFVRTNLSVSELIDFLYDPTWPLKGIDDTVVTAFPMYQINPDTMIAYQALSGAFGATGRDIVYATTRVLSSDGSWGVVSAVTVDLPVIETEEFKRRFSKRFVRATVVRAGMEVRIENNGLRLTYISQTDGKEVMLPNWVLDRIRVGHLRRIVSLREFIQTHLQR